MKSEKTQMRFGGRPVGIPLTETQGALIVRWLNSEGVMEALAEVAPLYVDEACGSCVHRRSEHDPETGACLRDQPTFGPCPCEGWYPLSRFVTRILKGKETPAPPTSGDGVSCANGATCVREALS